MNLTIRFFHKQQRNHIERGKKKQTSSFSYRFTSLICSYTSLILSIIRHSNRHGSANPSTRIIIQNLLSIRSPLCLTRDDSNPNQFILFMYVYISLSAASFSSPPMTDYSY